MFQTALRFRNTWGGRREGAGRKKLPKGRRSTEHRARPVFASRYPVHLTLRMAPWVATLRRRRALAVIERTFLAAQGRFGLRLVDFSIEDNHLHLIVETPGKDQLRRAMTGFGVRLARRLNKVSNRRGQVVG